MFAIVSRICWIWAVNSSPSPRNTAVHSAAATASKTRKRVHDMASAPAIGAATTDTPGTNFAAISEWPPQRRMSDSLWRTHESGDIEMRHSSRMTRWPCRRPLQNHTVSPATLASSDAAKTVAPANWPADTRPPATTSTGAAGTGAPMRAASVTANTMSTPCCSRRSTRSFMAS